ncbi:unnamed protein product [Aphanomyces euteiches]
MKRTLSILALFICMALVFVGCSGTGDKQTEETVSTTNAPTSSAKEENTAKPASQEPVKFSVFIQGGGGNPLQDKDPIIQQLNKDLNMVMDFNIGVSEYNQVLTAKITGGTPPDVFSVSSVLLKQLADQNLLLDLGEYLDKMPNIKQAYTASDLNKGKYKGKIYALDKRPTIPMATYWIRADWLKKLNLPVPKTIEEFQKVLVAFTENDPDGNNKKDTFGLTGADLPAFSGIFSPFGIANPGNWMIRDNKVVYSTTDPIMKTSIAYIANLIKSGVVDPEILTNQNPIDKAFKGQAGVIYTNWPSISTDAKVKIWKDINPNAEWVQLDALTGPGGKYQGIWDVGNTQGMFALSKSLEKQPDKLNKILEYLNYITDPGKGQRVVNYGVEGVHYKLENDKVVALPAMSELAYAYQEQLTGRSEMDYLKAKFTNQGPYIEFAMNQPRIQTYSQFVPLPEGAVADDRYEYEELVKFMYNKRPLSEWDDYVKTLDTKFNLPARTVEAERGDYRAIEEQYDIVVCGGGLAGFCAAVAAARYGAKVILVQDRAVFGGNSSSEIRVPPQGAASFHAYARETGIISELLIEERARNHEEPTFDNGYINSMWDLVLYDMAVTTPNLTFQLNTTISEVLLRDDKTIEAVIAHVSHAETVMTIRGQTYIDCTGDGIVAAFAGCEWRMGTESRAEFGEPHAPEQASDAVMGNSIHFKAKDTGRPVPFIAPDWAVRYDNPDFFYKQGRVPGDPRSGFWWIELSVPWHTIYDNEKLRHELTRHTLGVWDWIKNKDPRLKDEASTYAIDWIGQVPGKRESRRIMGEYLMTEHDPLQKTVFPDEVAYGGWFIDLHEPGGLLAPYSEQAAVEADQPGGGYMAKSYVGPYGIPLRILIAKGMNNLMMAGRNVSVTHAALGTVRVMGTTALMGQAAGTAAALALRAGLSIREMPERAAREVQQALLRDGCFLPNVVNEDPRDLARSANIQASSEDQLVGSGPIAWDSGGRETPGVLDTRRGQWIAIGADRIELLAVCLDNHSDTVQYVEARLYSVDHLWDYRVEAGQPLATAMLKVDRGSELWVEWPVGMEVSELRGGYIRLDLLANPLVSWHKAGENEPGHVSAYDLENGQMRRYGRGQMMSFRIEPPQSCYEAGNALSGVTRPYRSTNMWRSAPSSPLPQWLELSWEQSVEIGRVELTYTGNILYDYRNYPGLHRDPQCAMDITVEVFVDERWMEIGAQFGNYQRRGQIVPEKPVRSKRLRIIVHATNGDPSASIYEIRCYPD